MSKSVRIISTSPPQRRQFRHSGGGICQRRAGGREPGGESRALRQTIGFCKGCLACQKTLRCVIHDDEMGKCV